MLPSNTCATVTTPRGHYGRRLGRRGARKLGNLAVQGFENRTPARAGTPDSRGESATVAVRRPAGDLLHEGIHITAARHADAIAWSKEMIVLRHYRDPRHMDFRQLRVINEYRMQPGRGLGSHAHEDME